MTRQNRIFEVVIYFTERSVAGVMCVFLGTGESNIDNSRKGVRFVSYNAILPPPTGLFAPPTIDFSNSGLEEFQQPNVLKAMVLQVNTAKPKAVNIARPTLAVVNAVRANQVNAVKASACWVWRPTKLNSASIIFKRQNYIDARGISKQHVISHRLQGILIDDMLPLGEEPEEEELLVKELLKLATLDESMLWQRRLGHINFKTINKLVKDNLVRGLPAKHFENDQTCVACLKGKQHKAFYKSKIQNSITQPLFMLHIDLFGLTFMSSLMNKKYCLVVIDDYSRFTWVFFLAYKDETSGILKHFITEIENLVDKKVKIIRCGNGTEFKNRVMNEFCEKKGIKREFSVARTPQQNGVAERRNRTLIEAARTIGRTPALSFMRPFGCHVTILNTLDHLGKFDGKSDDGFFVGYSLTSKAFRVYNIRTRKVEENLHIRFLETKPIIIGDAPKWLFDIDSLTKSMSYVPVVAGTNSNDFAGSKESNCAGHTSKETEFSQDYIVMPLWKDGSMFDSSSKNSSNDEPQPSSIAKKKDDEGVSKASGFSDQEQPKSSTLNINTAGPSNNTASANFKTGSLNINTVSPTVITTRSNRSQNVSDMFSLGRSATLEATHADLFGDETEIDMGNLTTTYQVPTTANTKIHKDHSLNHVIGELVYRQGE
ncbi:putative ribonuclease H-like domain-containing protein [Tanacetum coccineum]|uniref:Ribonuclease H-like domain-containing protein n=1 Tax=Tanacetum coccineum TaxID=301880 RepID=A0ABQ5H2N5_9ASTR